MPNLLRSSTCGYGAARVASARLFTPLFDISMRDHGHDRLVNRTSSPATAEPAKCKAPRKAKRSTKAKAIESFEPRCLLSIPRRGGAEEIRLTVQRHAGAMKVRLGTWWWNEAEEAFCPCKRGVTLHAADLDAVIDQLRVARAVVQQEEQKAAAAA